MVELWWAVQAGVAHGLGLCAFLLALGLAPEGLIFLGVVLALALGVVWTLVSAAGWARPRLAFAERRLISG
jgi:hypothetical protein